MTDHHRATARVLLFDADYRLLLFLARRSSNRALPPRWITPGGGIEPGETAEQGAVRELFEETGLVVASLGKSVWAGDHIADRADGGRDIVSATYFVHHACEFTISNENWTASEHTDLLEHRWWSLAELLATDEPLEPVELPSLMRRELPTC